MTLAPGTRAGSYEVVRLLGAGGMGEVYLARDPRLGREVALKVLPADLAADPERLARFEREAKLVAALNHPNIVTLFGIEQVGDTRLLVMERVTGRPLSQVIDVGGLPVPRLLHLAIPIVDALAAAHDKGIIHRDLKPANVMVSDEGRVKVLDFGLATAQGPAGQAEATQLASGPMTGEGHVLGTIPYMAPEQLRGERVDARADIFAFGTLLYEMATGVRPFRGDSMMDVAAAILKEQPDPLDLRRADLPERLARVVTRCLEKDPRERFQSAIDVRHELQDLSDERRLRPPTQPGAAQTVAGTSVAPPASPSGSVASAAPVVLTGRRTRAIWLGAGLLLAAFASVALIVWAVRTRMTAPAASAGEIKSIAVLPFDNLTHDASQDYFVEGVHEALITDLAKLGTVRVTSRNSVMRYKGQAHSLKDVAKELGVDALIEGSVLRADNRVRVTAQLILGATDAHVWAQSYDRELRDVLSLLSDVSHSIAGEVQANLGGAAPPALAQAPGRQVNPQAFEAYLRGRHVMSTNVARAKDALVYFEEAAHLDPGFAQAWSGIAMCRLVPGVFGGMPAAEAAVAGRAAAQKALALDETDGRAYGVLGAIALYFDWRFDESRPLLERAVSLNPHDVGVHHAYADYFMIRGEVDRSLEEVKLGRSYDPTSPMANAFVTFHSMVTRRYDETIAECRRVLEKFPDQPLAQSALADALWYQGRYDEALPLIRARFADDAEGWRLFESAFERGGPRAAHEALGDHLVRRSAGPPVNPYTVARTYAEAGNRDATLAWLEKAYAVRLPNMLHMTVDPAFDSVRDDPRFKELLARIGIPSARRPS